MKKKKHGYKKHQLQKGPKNHQNSTKLQGSDNLLIIWTLTFVLGITNFDNCRYTIDPSSNHKIQNLHN